jgi:thiol-disulfide isomerase/thioredoxin
MDWSQYRTAHLSQYGSTSRQQLSKDYQDYKMSMSKSSKSLKSPSKSSKYTVKSPLRPVKSPRMTTKPRLSPTKSIKSVKSINIVESPRRSILKAPKSPSKNLSVKFEEDVVRGRSPVRSKKLTLKDVEKMAADKKFLIVVVYADWCGHCKDMKQKLGNKMKDTDKIVFVEQQKMDGLSDYFPRVMYFENGERQNDLTVDNVYDYLL